LAGKENARRMYPFPQQKDVIKKTDAVSKILKRVIYRW
jgi:hypothetical protein